MKSKFNKLSKNTLSKGILYLKGGYLKQKIAESGLKVQQFELKDHFSEEFLIPGSDLRKGFTICL